MKYNSRRIRAPGLPVVLITALLAGCAGQSVAPTAVQPSIDTACSQRLQRLDQQIEAADISDPLGYPIDGYPYLRSNRLLASFGQQLSDDNRFEHWYQRLYQHGQQSRAIELANLQPPYSAQAALAVERCIEAQAERDRQAPGFRQQLIERTQVPELYNEWQRALGLFPLTRQIVLHRIAQQQAIWQRTFNSPALLSGSSRRFAPPASDNLPQALIGDWLQQAQRDNPLAIPQLSDQRQQQLFRHFAPVWQLFQPTSSDWIGSLYWRNQQPALNSSDPVSYLIPSYTRFNGRILLQLNYLVWFAQRPPQSPLDLYSGRLDGMLWRVTLDQDGSVLLYDSIHPCGCYHQIFPASPRLQLKPVVAGVERPLIVTGVAPQRSQGRVVLQLTGQDHYLQGISLQGIKVQGISLQENSTPGTTSDNPQATYYRFDNYHRLRSLPADQGRRNLFAADGLVRGSERLERWLLWPMGVPSPGAMRVWGRHAIGFASKRYFDDPQLLQQFFE